MAKFILLSAVLSIAAAKPISVPHFHGQLFLPLFQHLQQQYQQYLIDRSDQESAQNQHFADSDYNNQAFHNQDPNQNNAIPPEEENQNGHEFGDHEQQQQPDYSAFTNFEENLPEGRGELGFEQQHPSYVHSVPVSEHVEVSRPVGVPVYREIGVPVPHPIKINIPHPVTIGVPQPYPVAVPISQPVPIQITKTVAVPVEKKVPYPVEKHIPVPIEKPVPIKIEKHVPVPVYKPYPIKIPVYKTIYHHAKGRGGYHGHGHGHHEYNHGHGHGHYDHGHGHYDHGHGHGY